MKSHIAIAIALGLFAAAPAYGQGIEVTPVTARPSTLGAAENFTGSVVIDPLFAATEHTRATDSQVTFQPGVKHWHGGTAANGMSHVAIQETVNGEVVRWMEHVGDDQYLATPRVP